MLSVLPLLVWWLAAMTVAARTRRDGKSFDRRECILISAVLTAAWGVLGAEVLSAAGWFARWPAVVWWVVPIVLLGIRGRTDGLAGRVVLPKATDRTTTRLIVVASVIGSLTFVIALLTPPTTWDCIGYHLPRQTYWIQNHSVSFYPSGDLRQLEMPPMAEYLGAQLMLLSGTDHQANMIQWFAYVLAAIAASVIAKELGAGARGQALAAALALLNPAAATQSVNPKNDIVLSLWILILIWSAIRIWNTRRCSWNNAALIGLTLGLAVLTKGTAFAFAIPVCLLIAVGCFRASPRRAIQLGAIMVLTAAAINTPHWVRNTRAFGSPLGLSSEKGGFPLANTTFSPAAIASNCLRNLTLHTSTSIPSLDGYEQRAVEGLHHALGLEPSDPRTTIRNQQYSVTPRWFSDGASGAPVHLILAFAMFGAIALQRWRPPVAWPAYLIPIAGALIFAALFKWQPWHCRLHIPIVAAAAPFLGVWLGRSQRPIWVATIPAFAIALAGSLWNEAKPLLDQNSILFESREEIMFQTQPGKLADARTTIELLAKLKPRTVALEIERATCEYPVQRMVLDGIDPQPTLRVLRRLVGPEPRRGQPPPDAAITLYPNLPSVVEDGASGTPLQWISGEGRFRLYVPVERAAAAARLLPVPAFFGWDSEDGLRFFEGPYPQWKLPVIRWADKRLVTLSFRSEGDPMLLVLECRRNQRQDQAMEVELNGKLLLRHEFGESMDFTSLRVPLDAPAGLNAVTIRFANLNEPEQPLAALFRKVQIAPASRLETPLETK